MKRACIAVVDAARARIFNYDEDASPGDELREVHDLSNAGRRLKGSEMFSEARPGLASSGSQRRTGANGNRSDSGVPGSAYDDHRAAHVDELDSRFAKEVVDTIDQIVREQKLVYCVLVAPPKMLGTLRRCNGILHRADLETQEVARDLTTVTQAQLHDQLAALDILAPRQRLKIAR
jgi:protein required for attachment to host cells